MRRFLLAAMMFGAVTGAQAADMPDFLRGSLPASSAPTRNWDGWYAGGQVGQTWINTDFGGSVASLTNSIFRNTTLQGPTSQFNLLGRVNAQSSGFGAFVGRNYQFDDVVVGVEANYTYWSGLTTTTSGSLGPIQVAQPTLVLPAGASAADGVTLNGSASLKLKDEITFRGRAGWATGDFLPYAFGGLAVGRMDVSRTVTSSVNRTINFADGSSTTFALPQFSQTATDAKTDAYVAGWTAGLGLEYMLWNCVFVRGEWEYVKFAPVKNTSVTQNSVRAAIGYKF
ncbi:MULTISPECIES: outer membrane protein [unclassified Bradyrhizobium]|uniref:outer membrane protein n=1 Tax=unclassified Bradyrhizobium TaxID=2631580 RepID=UPI001BA9BBF2|nr:MULTISPECIES: outer membrane beta-barrel protein [unclassified Bradyrhizobium]MBR1207950.1 porin family protein [Bradyrhizobium sp. AUGA SZCCT0124]MBR1314540.1 porin family protein [Bradyrhizobium sp. AUGA SZCCT0051]MBR1342440.1 porin family protein [Bradyrhizobium sp. AUGA SZCCT0105]MBR1352670.1 porin family protein [Bradyrhizobium sp. AUGA SZCCT0045]